MQHEPDEEVGGELGEAEGQNNEPDGRGHRQHDPGGRQHHETGLGEMRAQLPRIDPQEGEHQQEKDRLGDERLEQDRERRHRQAQKDRGRDRAGAVAPEKSERRRQEIEQTHRLKFRSENKGAMSSRERRG